MQSSRFFRFVTAAGLLVAAAGASKAQDATIRWKFAKGQSRDYEVNQTTSSNINVQGQLVESKTTQVLNMTWKVLDVDREGTASMEQKINRIQIKTTGPMGFTVDTQEKSDPAGTPEAVSKIFRAMTAGKFKMKMTNRGDIQDTVVPEEMIAALKSGGPMAAALANADSLKAITSQASLVFPEEALAKGKTWTAVKKMDLPFGTMVLDTSYILEAPSGSIQNIGIKVNTTIEPKGDAPISIRIKKQDSGGRYQFDNKAGELKASEMTQHMTMQMTVQGQDVEQEVSSSVKMELKSSQ